MDEIFRSWYGLGGDWINLGPPHYVQMDCKPDAGCKIQDNCYGRSMVMMKLKLAKGKTADKEDDSANGTSPYGDVNHGIKVLKELVYTWSVKGDRMVASDSYFSSMQYEK